MNGTLKTPLKVDENLGAPRRAVAKRRRRGKRLAPPSAEVICGGFLFWFPAHCRKIRARLILDERLGNTTHARPERTSAAGTNPSRLRCMALFSHARQTGSLLKNLRLNKSSSKVHQSPCQHTAIVTHTGEGREGTRFQ